MTKPKFWDSYRFWMWVYLSICLFLLVVLFSISLNLIDERDMAVDYCEIANIQIEISNELWPYYGGYTDGLIKDLEDLGEFEEAADLRKSVDELDLYYDKLDCPERF